MEIYERTAIKSLNVLVQRQLPAHPEQATRAIQLHLAARLLPAFVTVFYVKQFAYYLDSSIQDSIGTCKDSRKGGRWELNETSGKARGRGKDCVRRPSGASERSSGSEKGGA